MIFVYGLVTLLSIPRLAGWIGVLSAAPDGRDDPAFPGRFTSAQTARGAVLCVSLGLAACLWAALNYLS